LASESPENWLVRSPCAGFLFQCYSRAWGIRTCLDLARADRRLVRELLTASGEALWWELNGDPVTAIHSRRPLHKRLSRGGSFGGASDRPEIVWAWLVRNVERLIEELRYHEVRTAHVSLWLGYRDGRFGEAHASLEAPSDRFDVLIDVLRPCLRQAWIARAMANRMHLVAHKLVPRTPAQLGLFESPNGRAEALARLKHDINHRHGRFALRSAATLPLCAIYEDDANDYDICDVRDKSCF
jgi:DNA polymerase V